MGFEFLAPGRIIFGENSIEQIPQAAVLFGSKIYLITGGKSLEESGYLEKITSLLTHAGISITGHSQIHEEPSPEMIDRITDIAGRDLPDVILAAGGGSVIDTAKAVSALLVNKKGVENYLEGVGHGYKVINPPLPVIAVPTTAGSGAEVTRNAVITDHQKGYKKSFRDDRMIPRIVIADPLLTLSMPLEQTLHSGMDALCQLAESHTAKKRNPWTQALTRFYIPRAVQALLDLKADLSDRKARTVMLEASVASGLTLTSAGLGAVHGLASGIGGIYPVRHGLVCAVLMPHVFQLNRSHDPELYQDIIIDHPDFDRHSGFDSFLFKLNTILGIPAGFQESGFKKEQITDIIRGSKGGSMNGNPVDLSDSELEDLLFRVI